MIMMMIMTYVAVEEGERLKAALGDGGIINIRHSIYSGIDRVQLNFFSKNRINGVLELEFEHTNNDCRMF